MPSIFDEIEAEAKTGGSIFDEIEQEEKERQRREGKAAGDYSFKVSPTVTLPEPIEAPGRDKFVRPRQVIPKSSLMGVNPVTGMPMLTPEEAEGAARVIGTGLGAAGRDVRDTAAAAAYKAAEVVGGDPEAAFQQIVAPEAEKPLREDIARLPLAGEIASTAAYGLAESAPRLAAMTGLTAAGVPAPIAGGLAFGFTEEGFSPQEAAIGAILPSIGKYSGEISGILAKRLGISNDLAMRVLRAAGHVGGPTAYLSTIQASEIAGLAPEDRPEAIKQAVASNVGFLALSFPGGVGELSRVTPRVQGPVATGAVLPRQVTMPPPPPVPERGVIAKPEILDRIIAKKATKAVAVQRIFPDLKLSIDEAQQLLDAANLKKGAPDASQVSPPAEVYGDVRTQPEQGAGQMPIPPSVPGVQPQAARGIPEAPKGDIPLTPEDLAASQKALDELTGFEGEEPGAAPAPPVPQPKPPTPAAPAGARREPIKSVTIDDFNEVLNMDPAEFAAKYPSFTKAVIAFGEKMTPEQASQLETLHNFATARSNAAREKAMATRNAQDAADAGALSSLPQFFNEALKAYKRTKGEAAPAALPEASQIAQELGMRYDAAFKVPGRWAFTLFDKEGKDSTTFTVPEGSTVEQVRKAYLDKLAEYGDDPNAPRPPKGEAAPKSDVSKAPAPSTVFNKRIYIKDRTELERRKGNHAKVWGEGATAAFEGEPFTANPYSREDRSAHAQWWDGWYEARGRTNADYEAMQAQGKGVPAEPAPEAPAPGSRPGEVSKLGTGKTLNEFGDPIGTSYQATPEDWAEWQRLMKLPVMKGGKQDMALLQAREDMKNKYGGMPPNEPAAAAPVELAAKGSFLGVDAAKWTPEYIKGLSAENRTALVKSLKTAISQEGLRTKFVGEPNDTMLANAIAKVIAARQERAAKAPPRAPEPEVPTPETAAAPAMPIPEAPKAAAAPTPEPEALPVPEPEKGDKAITPPSPEVANMVPGMRYDSFPAAKEGEPDLVVIGCVKGKRPTGSSVVPARDLYTSDLFSKRRDYAEKTGRPYFILSARFGAAEPMAGVSDYNLELGGLTKQQKEAWRANVRRRILDYYGDSRMTTAGKVVEIHAGKDYVDAFRSAVEGLGIEVKTPMEGKGIGEQLSAYKGNKGELTVSETVKPIPGIKSNPIGAFNGVPVYQGREARAELSARFGIPNSMPDPKGSPFGQNPLVFIDDATGETVAYHRNVSKGGKPAPKPKSKAPEVAPAEAPAKAVDPLAPDKAYFRQFADLDAQMDALREPMRQANADVAQLERYRPTSPASRKARGERLELASQKAADLQKQFDALMERKRQLALERQVESYDYETYIKQGKELPADRERNYGAGASGEGASAEFYKEISDIATAKPWNLGYSIVMPEVEAQFYFPNKGKAEQVLGNVRNGETIETLGDLIDDAADSVGQETRFGQKGFKSYYKKPAEGEGGAEVSLELKNPMVVREPYGYGFDEADLMAYIKTAVANGHDGLIILSESALPKTVLDKIDRWMEHPGYGSNETIDAEIQSLIESNLKKIDWQNGEHTIITFDRTAEREVPAAVQSLKPDEALDLFNAGKITKKQLDELLGKSDIPPEEPPPAVTVPIRPKPPTPAPETKAPSGETKPFTDEIKGTRIVATAVRNPSTGQISSGHTIHVELYPKVGLDPVKMSSDEITKASGYLTDKGEFVSQAQADEIAQRHGQISRQENLSGEYIKETKPAPGATKAPESATVEPEPIQPVEKIEGMEPKMQAKVDEMNRLIGLRDENEGRIAELEKERDSLADTDNKRRGEIAAELSDLMADNSSYGKEISRLQNETFDARWAAETAPYRVPGYKAAATEPNITSADLKQQQKYLIEETNKALKAAPEKGTGKVHISVPGDGDFYIDNNKAALSKFRTMIEKGAKYKGYTSPKFPVTVPKAEQPGLPSGKATSMPKVEANPKAKDAAGIAGQYVSEDPSREVIQTGYADGTQIIATDGRHLIRIVTDEAPGRPDKPVRLDAKGNVVAGKGDYPNYNQVISQNPDLARGGVRTDELFQVATQAEALFPKDSKNPPTVQLFVNKDGSIGAKASDPNVGEYEHNVQPDALDLGRYNPSYVRTAAESARKLGNERVDLYLHGIENGALEFRGKNHQTLLMPFNLSGSSGPIRSTKGWGGGERAHGSLPLGLEVLRDPDSFLGSGSVDTPSGKWSADLEAGEFKIQRLTPGKEGQWRDVSKIPLDKFDAAQSDKARQAIVSESIKGEFEGGKVPAEVSKKVSDAMRKVIAERRKIIEAAEERVPRGEGGKLYAGLPLPELAGLLKPLEKIRGVLQQRWQNVEARHRIDQLADGAETKANNLARQMGNKLRYRRTEEQDVAAAAVIAAGFKPGELPNLLALVQGKNPKAEAGIRYAMANFAESAKVAYVGKKILDWEARYENSKGIDTLVHENYLPGIYDQDLWMGTAKPYVIGKPRGAGAAFKKGKTYDTPFHAVGDGLVPTSLKLSDMVEHRVKAGQRLVNRRTIADTLKVVMAPSDGKPIAINIPTISRGPGLPSYESLPPGYQAREVAPGVRYGIHEDFLKLFDAVTGQRSAVAEWEPGGLPVGEALLNVEGGVKHGLLVFDTFHASRILQKAMFLNRGKPGYKKGHSLLEYANSDLARLVADKEITQEMADWVKANRPLANMLQHEGLNVGRIQEAMYSGFIRSIQAQVAKAARAIGVPKGITEVIEFNKWVFEKVTRGAMLESAIIEFNRIKRQNPEWTDRRIARYVARNLNAYFGNLGRQGVFKSATMLDASRLAMLAPQWVESMARSEILGAAQLAKAPFESAAARRLKVGTLGSGLMTGAVAYVFATQLLNLATRGHLTFQNDEKGHKWDAWIPDVTGKGPGFFISPLSVVAELTHDMIRYAPDENEAGGLAKLGAAANHIRRNRQSPLWRSASILATGRDWDDRKIVGAWERAKRAAWALAPVPIPASPLIKGDAPQGQLQRQLTASAGFKTEPVKSSVSQINSIARDYMESSEDPQLRHKFEAGVKSDFGQSDYYEIRKALQREDFETAFEEYQKLRATKKATDIAEAFRPYSYDEDGMPQAKPIAGMSRAETRKFLRSLTPQQRKIYEASRNELKKQHRRFQEMLRRAPRPRPAERFEIPA